jgi:hypothetical protein
LSQPVRGATAVSTRVDALVQTGELTNVVFFGRPAASSANREAIVFVLEPGSAFARRATVRYGAISGPLIQIVEGLAPGDRVIVTDMSKWAKYPRVRIVGHAEPPLASSRKPHSQRTSTYRSGLEVPPELQLTP